MSRTPSNSSYSNSSLSAMSTGLPPAGAQTDLRYNKNNNSTQRGGRGNGRGNSKNTTTTDNSTASRSRSNSKTSQSSAATKTTGNNRKNSRSNSRNNNNNNKDNANATTIKRTVQFASPIPVTPSCNVFEDEVIDVDDEEESSPSSHTNNNNKENNNSNQNNNNSGSFFTQMFDTSLSAASFAAAKTKTGAKRFVNFLSSKLVGNDNNNNTSGENKNKSRRSNSASNTGASSFSSNQTNFNQQPQSTRRGPLRRTRSAATGGNIVNIVDRNNNSNSNQQQTSSTSSWDSSFVSGAGTHLNVVTSKDNSDESYLLPSRNNSSNDLQALVAAGQNNNNANNMSVNNIGSSNQATPHLSRASTGTMLLKPPPTANLNNNNLLFSQTATGAAKQQQQQQKSKNQRNNNNNNNNNRGEVLEEATARYQRMYEHGDDSFSIPGVVVSTTAASSSSIIHHENELISKKKTTTTKKSSYLKQDVAEAEEDSVMVPGTSNANQLLSVIDFVLQKATKKVVQKQVESSKHAITQVLVRSYVKKIVAELVEVHMFSSSGNNNNGNNNNMNFRQRLGTTTLLSSLPSSSSKSSSSSSSSFPDSDRQFVRGMLANKSEQSKIKTVSGFDITVRDFRSVLPSNWLTDNIVNSYLGMVISPENMKYRRKNLQNRPEDVVLLNSHFFARLGKEGIPAAQRWVATEDIFDARLVIMPANQSNTHWTLVVVDVLEQRFCFFDSMGSQGKSWIKGAKQFFTEMWKQRRELREKELEKIANTENNNSNKSASLDHIREQLKNSPNPNGKKAKKLQMDYLTPLPAKSPMDWKEYCPGKLSPQQVGPVDCGVFTCQTAAHLVWGTPIWNLEQKYMVSFRELMALELLEGKLLPRC